MQKWCDRCDIGYADFRVTFTEPKGHWGAEHYVQNLCEECANTRRSEGHRRDIWNVEVFSL